MPFGRRSKSCKAQTTPKDTCHAAAPSPLAPPPPTPPAPAASAPPPPPPPPPPSSSSAPPPPPPAPALPPGPAPPVPTGPRPPMPPAWTSPLDDPAILEGGEGGGGGGGGDDDDGAPSGGLAAALASARLRKVDDLPAMDTPRGNMSKASTLPPKQDMMSDLMQRLQSRKAKDGNKASPLNRDIGRSSPSLSSSTSSLSSLPSGRDGLSRSNVNISDNSANECREKKVSFGSSVGTKLNRDSLKQEIVTEIRKELNKIKNEIIKAVRIELSNSR